MTTYSTTPSESETTYILHRADNATYLCCLDDFGNARDNGGTEFQTEEPWATCHEDYLPAKFMRYGISFTTIPEHKESIEYYKQRDPTASYDFLDTSIFAPTDNDVEFRQYGCSEMSWLFDIKDVDVHTGVIDRTPYGPAAPADGKEVLIDHGGDSENEFVLNGLFLSFINHNYLDAKDGIAWQDDYQARRPYVEYYADGSVNIATLSWKLADGASAKYGAPTWGFRQNSKDVFAHDPEDQRTDLTTLFAKRPDPLPDFHPQKNDDECDVMYVRKADATEEDLKKAETWFPTKFVIQMIARTIDYDGDGLPGCPRDELGAWDPDQGCSGPGVVHFAYMPDTIFGLEETDGVIEYPVEIDDPFLGVEINEDDGVLKQWWIGESSSSSSESSNTPSSSSSTSSSSSSSNTPSSTSSSSSSLSSASSNTPSSTSSSSSSQSSSTPSSESSASSVSSLSSSSSSSSLSSLSSNTPSSESSESSVSSESSASSPSSNTPSSESSLSSPSSNTPSSESSESSLSSASSPSSNTPSSESSVSSASSESSPSSESSNTPSSTSSSSLSSELESSSSSSSQSLECPVKIWVYDLFVYLEMEDGSKLLLFRGKKEFPVGEDNFPFEGSLTFENELPTGQNLGQPYVFDDEDLKELCNVYWSYKMLLPHENTIFVAGQNGTVVATPSIVEPTKLSEKTLTESFGIGTAPNKDYAGYFTHGFSNPAFQFVNDHDQWDPTKTVDAMDKAYKDAGENKPSQQFTPATLCHNCFTLHTADRRVFDGELETSVFNAKVIDKDEYIIQIPGIAAMSPEAMTYDGSPLKEGVILMDPKCENDLATLPDSGVSIYHDSSIRYLGGDRECEEDGGRCAGGPPNRVAMVDPNNINNARGLYCGVHFTVGDPDVYDSTNIDPGGGGVAGVRDVVNDPETDHDVLSQAGELGLSRSGRAKTKGVGNAGESGNPYWRRLDLSSDMYVLTDLPEDAIIPGTNDQVKVKIKGEFAIRRFMRQLVQSHISVSNDRPRSYKFYEWDDDGYSFGTADKYNCIMAQSKIESLNFALTCYDGKYGVWRLSELLTDASIIYRKMLKQYPNDVSRFYFTNVHRPVLPGLDPTAPNIDGMEEWPFCYAADGDGIKMLKIKRDGTFTSQVLVNRDMIANAGANKWFSSYLAATELIHKTPIESHLNAVDDDFTRKFTSGMLFDVSPGTCNLMSDHYKLPYIRSFALAIKRLYDINRFRARIHDEEEDGEFKPIKVGLRPLDLYNPFVADGASAAKLARINNRLEEVEDELEKLDKKEEAIEATRASSPSVPGSGVGAGGIFGGFSGVRPITRVGGGVNPDVPPDIALADVNKERFKFNKEKEALLLEKAKVTEDERDLYQAWFQPSGCSATKNETYKTNLAYQFSGYESYLCGYYRQLNVVNIDDAITEATAQMEATGDWLKMFGAPGGGAVKLYNSDTQTVTASGAAGIKHFYSDVQSRTTTPWLPPGIWRIEHTTVSGTGPVNSAVTWPGAAGYSIHDPADLCEGSRFFYTFAPPCNTITYSDAQARDITGWPRLTPGDVRYDDSPCTRQTFANAANLAQAIIDDGACKYFHHFGGPVSFGVPDPGIPDNLTYKIIPEINLKSSFIKQTVVPYRTAMKFTIITSGTNLFGVTKGIRIFTEAMSVERGDVDINLAVEDDCLNMYPKRPIEWMGIQATSEETQTFEVAACPDGFDPMTVWGVHYCPKGNLSVHANPYRISAFLTGSEFCNRAISFHQIPELPNAQGSYSEHGIDKEGIDEIFEDLKRSEDWRNGLQEILNHREEEGLIEGIDELAVDLDSGNIIRFRDFDNTTLTTGTDTPRKVLERITCNGYIKSTLLYDEDGWWDLPSSSSSSSGEPASSETSESSTSSEEEICLPHRADHIEGELQIEEFAFKRGRIITVEEGALYVKRHNIKNVNTPNMMQAALGFVSKVNIGGDKAYLEAYIQPNYYEWEVIKQIVLTYNPGRNSLRKILFATLGESMNTVDEIPLYSKNDLPEFYTDGNIEKIIDMRMSNAGLVAVYGAGGAGASGFAIRAATAIKMDHDDFLDFKIGGPYSSVAHDAQGTVYTFYERTYEPEASSSSEEEDDPCPPVDPWAVGVADEYPENWEIQANVDQTKETNICVAVSYNNGQTWFEFNDLIWLKNDESAQQPYAVSDPINNRIYLYFIFAKHYLAVKIIDCSLFDINDTYVRVDRLSEFEADTPNNAGLGAFSAKGQALRQSPIHIIDGGPPIFAEETMEDLLRRDPCIIDSLGDDDDDDDGDLYLKKFKDIKREIETINPIRVARWPTGGGGTAYLHRIVWGRDLEFNELYDNQEFDDEEKREKIRSYDKTLFCAYHDNKGIPVVFYIDQRTGLGGILAGYAMSKWVPVIQDVCFHALNPYEIEDEEDEDTWEYRMKYEIRRQTFVCDTYFLGSFGTVTPCGVRSDEFATSYTESEPKFCKSRREKIETLREELEDLKERIDAMGTPQTEEERRQKAALIEQFNEKQRELNTLLAQDEAGMAPENVMPIMYAAKVRQIQIAYDEKTDQAGFVFIYDTSYDEYNTYDTSDTNFGLFVRPFDNSIIHMLGRKKVEKNEVIKWFELQANSPNKPMFIVGRDTPTRDVELYDVLSVAKKDVIATYVQPAAYYGRKGLLKVYYCDSEYSIWVASLYPNLVPYVEEEEEEAQPAIFFV